MGTAQTISLVWAVLLPAVATSVYFYAPVTEIGADTIAHNGVDLRSGSTAKAATSIELYEKSRGVTTVINGSPKIQMENQQQPVVKGKFSTRRAMRLMWTHFTESYSNLEVVQWSVWWALTTCGFMQVFGWSPLVTNSSKPLPTLQKPQVQSYVQFLWLVIDPERSALLNGAVEAVLTLLGAAAAFAAGYINIERFDRWSFWVLSLVSAAMGGLLLWGTLTADVWSSYAAYVLFGTATHFMVTVAAINVAKRLKDDSFGLVFGINTLLALVFQTILTLVVVSESGFGLNLRDQFKVNSGYFAVLAVCFGLTGIGRLIWRRCRRRRERVQL